MGVIETIEEALEDGGWHREGVDWVKAIGVAELGDPSRYIGERPLEAILAGDLADVYGTGAAGVASFIAECYVGESAEDVGAWLGIDVSDDEEGASDFVESFVHPEVDEADIAAWLAERGR